MKYSQQDPRMNRNDRPWGLCGACRDRNSRWCKDEENHVVECSGFKEEENKE